MRSPRTGMSLRSGYARLQKSNQIDIIYHKNGILMGFYGGLMGFYGGLMGFLEILMGFYGGLMGF